MTIAVKMLNDHIKKISETNTLLDMLLEFEKILDTTDVYAYKNWIKGEVLEGPKLGRHWVTVKLMYPYESMPDPDGAKRLMGRECLVKYSKDTLVTPVKVRSYDDVTLEARPDGSTRYKAKTKSEPIWIVEIKMPRRYVDEFASEVVEADEDSYVDTESLNAENEIQNQQAAQQTQQPQQGGLV
jgi:hypothetical protein